MGKGLSCGAIPDTTGTSQGKQSADSDLHQMDSAEALKAFDDVKAGPLPVDLVQAARAEELEA